MIQEQLYLFDDKIPAVSTAGQDQLAVQEAIRQEQAAHVTATTAPKVESLHPFKYETRKMTTRYVRIFQAGKKDHPETMKQNNVTTDSNVRTKGWKNRFWKRKKSNPSIKKL